VSDSLFEADVEADPRFAQIDHARDSGDWTRALELASALLRVRVVRKEDPSPGDYILIEVTADLATIFGLTAAACDLLVGSALLCEERNKFFIADYLRLKCCQVALGDGHFEDARDLLSQLEPRIGPLEAVPFKEEGLPTWEGRCRWPAGDISPRKDRSSFFSRLYLCLGEWLAAQGRYGHARVLLDRGTTHALPPASALACRAYVPLCLALSSSCLEQGQLRESDQYLRNVEATIDRRRQPGWRVRWLELTGYGELLRGSFGSGLERFEEVQAICREIGNARGSLTAIVNHAEILITLNQVTTAEEMLEDAGVLADALGDSVVAHRIARLRKLAEQRSRSPLDFVSITPSVIEMQGKVIQSSPRKESRPISEPNGAITLQATSFLALFEDCAWSVRGYLASGDVERAIAAFKGLIRCFDGVESPLIQLRLHIIAGMVAYYLEDYSRASQEFADVYPHLEERGLRPELWQVTRFREWCAIRAKAGEEEIRSHAIRAEELLDEMSSGLKPLDAAIYRLNKWTEEEKSLRRDIVALVRQQEAVDQSFWALRGWRRWRFWQSLHKFLDRMDSNRRRLAEDGLSGRSASVLGLASSLWDRLTRHSVRSATLSFLVLPDRVFIVTAGWMMLRCRVCFSESKRPGENRAVRVFTGRWQLRELIGLCHRAVRLQNDKLFEEVVGRIGHVLMVCQVVAELPRWVRRLTVVADDSLHGFPFAALRINGGHLIDHYALTFSYDQSPHVRRVERAAQPTALIVAVSNEASRIDAPEGTQASKMRVPALDGALPEANEVGQWLVGHGFKIVELHNLKASKGSVLVEFPRASMIHLACHGIFEPGRPDASGLVLVSEADRGEILSLRDLAQCDLGPVQHITLSSCWGADSFVYPGRWVVSLPETLCRRGAGSVLSCRWEVDDLLARRFMKRFYKLLEQLPRDEAIRAVQQKCIRNELEDGSDTAHPFFWAGFCLHGDGGYLRIPSGRVTR